MSYSCDCTEGVKNFGQPGCVGTLERAQKFGFIRTKANDGTTNKIVAGDTLDQAYFDALINNADKSKRLVVSPVMNQMNDSRAEYNTMDVDGFTITTSEGVRTVTFSIIDGAHPRIAAAYNSMACQNMSFYVFSTTDQIGGNGSVAGELRPFRIKPKTMRAIYNPPSKVNETPPMVSVSFAISELENDGDIAYIPYGDGANDVQIIVNDLTGLIDVDLQAATNITTTGFKVVANLLYGNQLAPDRFKGGVLADFTLAEISPTPGAITITSVTEGTGANEGQYTFVIPTASSADVLRLTFSKDGYEALSTIDITIP